MATSPRYEKLDLDPGTVPTRKRRTSGCKCMLIAVGILITLLLSIGLAKVASSIFQGMREPHAFLYENKTLAEVRNLSSVVRPLVDREQKFDVEATVWVRTLDERDNASSRYGWMHGEEHIYSGRVFRGVTLMDEHVHTKVNLSIPLETFSKAKTLENYDIRATFKLIPQSPSLLDHITGYTTWVPPTVIFPDISPETRARKLKGDFKTPDTLEGLQNAALESFAVSAPLIDLHPINSACGRKDVDGEEPTVGEEMDGSNALAPVASTKGFTALERHPYVVTRTDLRVVRMDKIYNKKAFDAHHNQLRRSESNGCIRAGNGLRDGRRCFRQFSSRANCETRIELEVPSDAHGMGQRQKQVAYAPYVSVNRRAWGPLDMVAMPVNREGCPESEGAEPPKFMHVTWNIAYSGSTADKLFLGEILGATNTYNVTDTEFNRVKAQQSVEILQRMHGHKHSIHNHVGRLLILDTIAVLTNFIRLNLQFHYWYTRSTTVGLSLPGSSLAALAFTLLFFTDLWVRQAFWPSQSVISSVYAVVMAVYWNLLTAGVILRAVGRVESKEGFPWVGVVGASHLERASGRVEMKGRKWWIVGTILGSFLFSLTLRDLPLLPRLGPPPDPTPPSSALPKAIDDLLIGPLLLSANILQQTLNYRSKTFAGGYHLAAWLHLVVLVIGLAAYVPRGAGGFWVREPLSLEEGVMVLVAGSFVVQGVWYKRVEQDGDDKDSN